MHLRCCQNFRHVTLHNSPSQALGNRGFTHTSLTHQERVVFAAAAQHLDNPLHFLLTGDPPYPGGTKPQKMLRHLREQPPSLRERRDDVPAQLEEIYQRMMAKDRDERYASCEEVVAALDAWSRLDGSPAEFDSALGEANDLASSESAID